MKGKHYLGLAFGVGLIALASAVHAQTTVTFWGQSLPPTDKAALDEIIAAYQEQNPDVTINYVPVSTSETDESKLMTAVRGGVGPDVYFLNRFATLERASQGLLENLQPLIEAEDVDLASSYSEFAWGDVSNNSGVYALPFDTDARVLYYNRGMLEEAGIDLAPFDPANGPMTPDQVNEIAAQLNVKDANGQYDRIGFIPWFEQGWHYTWGVAYGGKFQDGNCKVTPTDAGAVAGLDYMGRSAEALGYQAVTQFLNSYYPPNSPSQSNPFLTGRVGMMINGDWMLPQFPEYAPDLDWAMTYVPSPNGEITSWSAGWSLAIPAGAKNLQAAYDFARFATGEEGQLIYTQKSGHLPTWASLIDEDIYDENHIFFKNLLPHTSPLFQLPTGALYWDELTRAQQAVLAGSSTAEAAMEGVASRVQPRLDRACAR